MGTADPHDAKAILAQLLGCAERGCDLFRLAVPDVVVKYTTLAFMVLLIGLMGLLIVRDSWRSYKIHTYKPDTAENVHTNSDTNAEGR